MKEVMNISLSVSLRVHVCVSERVSVAHDSHDKRDDPHRLDEYLLMKFQLARYQKM